MLKVIFFDAGGTLFSITPSSDEIFARACRELGFFVTEEDVRQHASEFDAYDRTHYPIEDQRKYLSEFNKWALALLGLEITDEDTSFIQDYFEKNLKEIKFPEVDEILTSLKKKGFRLGVISNAIPNQHERLKRLGLDRYFEDVILSSEVGFPKPDAKIFEEALRRFRIKPEEALYVGDNYEKDVLGAQKAGMKAVLIDRQKGNDCDCQKIGSLDELPVLMESL